MEWYIIVLCRENEAASENISSRPEAGMFYTWTAWDMPENKVFPFELAFQRREYVFVVKLQPEEIDANAWAAH